MQETDKHGSRVDEQLKHEDAALTHGAGVESRSQESRVEQDVDDLPNPADRPDVGDPPGLGVDQASAEHRAALALAVRPAVFPATRDTMLEVAGPGAPADVIRSLRSLPGGRVFANVQEVWEELGGATEGHHT